jgi:hypothetical protein
MASPPADIVHSYRESINMRKALVHGIKRLPVKSGTARIFSSLRLTDTMIRKGFWIRPIISTED